MMWVKIDSAAPHHHKLLSAGAEAAWLWVCGLCYANLHATDGVIHASALSALFHYAKWTSKRLQQLASQLVEVGLWHSMPGGGWVIHDYAAFQAPACRDAVEQKRKKERDKKKQQRAKKTSTDEVSSSTRRGVSTGKSRASSASSTCVPQVSPGDTPVLSRGDVSTPSQGDAEVVSSEPSREASRSPGPSRAEPNRTAPSSRQTVERSQDEISRDRPLDEAAIVKARELIDVLRQHCAQTILFSGSNDPGVLTALGQRMAEVEGGVDRERCELLAHWYTSGEVAWRSTRISVRELATKPGRLAVHIEEAILWDRGGRHSKSADRRGTEHAHRPHSAVGMAPAGGFLQAQARGRRGTQGS